MGSGRIFLLTQFFYPETAAVASYMTTLALELQRNGFEMTVLTSRARYQRSGSLPHVQEYNGVQIHRLNSTRFDKRFMMGRILNLVTFIVSACFKLGLGKRKPDLLLISNSPLLGMVGFFSHWFRSVPYVCMIQDVYPELAVKLGIIKQTSLARRVWDFINRNVYSNALSLVVLGKRMESKIRRSFENLTEITTPIQVIPDWADGDHIKPVDKRRNWFANEHRLSGKLVMLYSGNHGLAHDLETIIEAAERLKDDDRFFFMFIGEGGKKKLLMDMVDKKQLRNVKFLPYQPAENLAFTLTAGDIAIVTMEQGVEGLVIPSKIYGALAAGQAILGLVNSNTEIADIIAQYDCGFRVTPKDAQGIVRVLTLLSERSTLLEKMKSSARRCFEENFKKEMAMRKYCDLIDHCLSTSSNTTCTALREEVLFVPPQERAPIKDQRARK